MAKLIYSKDFYRLYDACKKAEEAYRSYLIQKFKFPKNYKLTTMLVELFNDEYGNKTDANSVSNLSNRLNKLGETTDDKMVKELYDDIVKRFETAFSEDNERLKRTKDALSKILETRIRGNNSKKGFTDYMAQTISENIGYIVGNYKEWTFLKRGKRSVDNKSDTGTLFKMELVDVDNKKMDFIIQEIGSLNDYKQYGRGDNRKFTYITNGVPLEYKSKLYPQFHLVKTTHTTDAVGPIVKHHLQTSDNNPDKLYDNILVDLVMMTITNKLDEGFPVFVTSNGGTGQRDFMLCSKMLEALNSKESLHKHVIDISSFNFEKPNLEKQDIIRIITEDKNIRAMVENEIHNIEDNYDLDEGEKNARIEELNKDKVAEQIIVKKYFGKKSIITNLFYGAKR